jgi:ATP-dependent RNA helicase RhlE
LTEFQSFGLAAPIAYALAEENHLVPTPIQTQTVPLAMAGRDIIGIAQTGTGKTAAFALPILHKLSEPRTAPERKTCRALVLSPTRELSSQILDSFRAYGRHLGLTTALAIGGVKMGRQVRSLLGGVDVLVATPGRLLDLVDTNALRLSRVSCLVLDEADRMLDMGFIHDIRKIIAKLPRERQTLLFSATMPEAIAQLATEMLRNPAKVAVAPVSSTVERVSQRVVHVGRQEKPAVLANLLRDEPIERALVFTRTKHGADKLVRGLGKAGIGAEAIHGNKSQSQRERVLAAFRQGQVRILVATDIAARGIDVEGVSHVVNYDLPNEPESYVHRIGRTARAGASGSAISLCDVDEMPYLRSIEKLIRMSLPATSRRGDPVPGRPVAKPATKPDISDLSHPAGTVAARGRRPERGRPGKPRRNGASLGAPNQDAERRRATGPFVKSGTVREPVARNELGKNTAAAKTMTAKTPMAKFPVEGGRDARAPGHGTAPVRRGRPATSPAPGHPARDLSRIAFLNRGIEPRRDSVPHRQSTGVIKHGEGRAD